MRRCGWCGVELRFWQINHCRVCAFYFRFDLASPPCGTGSRWNAQPDLVPWKRKYRNVKEMNASWSQ